MRDLKTLQTFFRDQVSTSSDQSKSSEQSIVSTEFWKNILPAGNLDVESAMNVYREGYVVRLTDALGETFEAVWTVLGDQIFFNTCAEFIKTHPSMSYNLSDYHSDFVKWLSNLDFMEELPFLTDLARFEWSFKNLFHQSDFVPANVNNIDQAQLPNMKFSLSPSALLFRSSFSIYEIWKMRGKKTSESVDFLDANRSCHLFLYRSQSDIHAIELSELRYRILFRLSEGSTLSEILDDSSFSTASPADVQAVFQLVVQGFTW